MKKLFFYREEGGKVVETSKGEKLLMAFRHNPTIGIVARVKGEGRFILWDKEEAESHLEDSEESLVAKFLEVYNAS